MVIERTYNIPLRREWLKVPRYKRAKKAIIAVKQFLAKHMHQEDFSKIKLGEHINLYTWENGIKNPPHHLKVNVKKTDDDIVYAELFGYELKIPEEKENKKSEKKEEKKEEVKTKKSEEKVKEEKKEEISAKKNVDSKKEANLEKGVAEEKVKTEKDSTQPEKKEDKKAEEKVTEKKQDSQE